MDPLSARDAELRFGVVDAVLGLGSLRAPFRAARKDFVAAATRRAEAPPSVRLAAIYATLDCSETISVLRRVDARGASICAKFPAVSRLTLISVGLSALALAGCGSSNHRSRPQPASQPAYQTPEQQAEKRFRYIAIGPAAGTPYAIQTNAVTSDDSALNVFDRYYPLGAERAPARNLPNQSETLLPVACDVEQHRVGGLYVRCTSPDGSVTAFDQKTLLAVVVP